MIIKHLCGELFEQTVKWLSIFIEYLDTPFVLEKLEDRRKDRKINLALLMIVVICSIFRKLNLITTEEYELRFAFLFHKWQILTYLWILFFCKFGNIHNYLDFFQTNTSWGFCWWSRQYKKAERDFILLQQANVWWVKRLLGAICEESWLTASPCLQYPLEYGYENNTPIKLYYRCVILIISKIVYWE